jgi:polyisoprenoid-binding protein YceI
MRLPALLLAGVLPVPLIVLAGFAAPAPFDAGSAERSAPAIPVALAAPVSPSVDGMLASAVARADTVLFTVASAGNVARYRVREQLASLEFPNDAVGETQGIEGRMMVTSAGEIVTGASRFIIRLSELASDSDRRDNYLRRNTLDTDNHPEAVFLPAAFRGIPTPLPTSGEATFSLDGQLTIRGNTFPVTWQVRAEFANGAVLGRAETTFTFEAAGLQVPRVASVLSIREDIRLEYDFRLTPLVIGGASEAGHAGVPSGAGEAGR